VVKWRQNGNWTWVLKFYTSRKTFIPPKNKFLATPLLASCYLRVWGLDTSFKRSLWNVVLQKNGENFLDETQDKWMDIGADTDFTKTLGKGEVFKNWLPGLEVRWYTPVWYTGSSLIGLKSYRHFFLAERPLNSCKIYSSLCNAPNLSGKSSKLLRPDAFLRRKICQKCVCGGALPRTPLWELIALLQAL